MLVVALVASLAAGVASAQQDNLSCRPGEEYHQVVGGIVDGFAAPMEAPNPRPALAPPMLPGPLNPAVNLYDQTSSDTWFGESLTSPAPAVNTVVSARLSTRTRPTAGNANDGFHLWQADTGNGLPGPRPLLASYSPPTTNGISTIDFGSTPGNVPTATGMTPITPPPQSSTLVLLALNTSPRVLDVTLWDDTAIDFIRLETCSVPPKKPYDLGVRKSREGEKYLIQVTNLGKPIPAGSKIEIVDLVPQGVSLGAFPPSQGWTCAPPGPIVGPDVRTCTFMVTTPIATNGALPLLAMQMKGKPECPNCVRVKLYVKTVKTQDETGALPHELLGRRVKPVAVRPELKVFPPPGSLQLQLVKEPDMTNNASCAF